MSDTWLLFEDQGHDAVQCTLYPLPKDYPRPVDAYIVFEHSGDFSIAARKAVHAVFTLARQRDFPVRPVNAGFDLAGKRHPDAGLAGQSGGLCFALAFARKLLNLDLPDIAATGVIGSDGTISQVKGIETKLHTALTLLKENDWIFFPRENQDHVPEDLISKIREKNIHMQPVSTLDQVIDILTDSTDAHAADADTGPDKASLNQKKKDTETFLKPSQKTRLGKALLAIALVAAFLLAGFQIFIHKKKPVATAEKPVKEIHEITMPRENNPMNGNNSILNSGKKGDSEHLEVSEALSANETTATTDTTGLEKPVNDNKGFE